MTAEAAAAVEKERRGWVGAGLAYLLAALMVAGIVHVVVVFMVPYFAPADAWSRLTAAAGAQSLALIEEGQAGAADMRLDPLFVHAACRLDISAEPARLSLSAPDRFWSLALFDPRSIIIFSLNDRTVAEGELDMLVVTAHQRARLREEAPAALRQAIVVDSGATDLVVLVRLYAPTEAARREAREIAARARCAPLGEG